MPLRLFGLLVALAAFPASAAAAPVIVLGAGGHAAVRNDRFVTGPALTPAPTSAAAGTPSRGRRTVLGELARLYGRHAIDHAAYAGYRGAWHASLRTAQRLRGTREIELGAVIANLSRMAAAGSLTASRLPALFLTLGRNRAWWIRGPLPSSGQRVEFKGSELVWEYYPGQGLELQELGSFGKADGLYTGGPADYGRMGDLLDELIPLAARRAGGLAWEYYFDFGGGLPPWTSAMSQGTALQALTDAYRAFGDRSYLTVARRALPLFRAGPPVGVSVMTPLGSRYLLYSFAPGAAVINGFLQSLIGLYDYAHVSGDPRAQALFAAGDAEARAEVPRYDTGAWSLYQPGQEDPLDYHKLVTGFLHQLCSRTGATVYCSTAARFERYLKTPPVLQLLTTQLPANRATSVRFHLSKISHVGIVVIRTGQTVFLTSANFALGAHAFAIPALADKGTYTIHLAATDLAGNFNRIAGTLAVG